MSEKMDQTAERETYQNERVEFTKEMRKDYTILIPDMLPVHFKLLRNVFTQHGYRVGLLKNTGRKVVDTGLKYVHNDTCYPALLVIGQMISALQSGKYDVNKVALMITQTGGGCRARASGNGNPGLHRRESAARCVPRRPMPGSVCPGCRATGTQRTGRR